ncbi:SDR family NAD(P)-dependent oxidoreductase [Flavobacterium sp. N3904]|uniref:SDR family NAD(P)-dependent oxidoreductase n=1 Tax=Flavobacterium sp. N3904 TaxID=2986835 RepID=UPI00222403B0|nr:SDR family NAD(P)-dependent oxidoreductase [Flavobacterium sp. N3904]
MTQISILGCGWLGLPLAKAMIENGFSVKGSTTSESKLAILDKFGIHSFLIALSEDKPIGDVANFLKNSSILIIDIPPKLRGSEKENFVSKIKNVIPYVEKSTIENVLFVSSTSVYGETNATITEETVPKPDTESGKQLLEVESLLQSNSNFKTTVLRFGGLIGEDRNPTKFMAGKVNIENPETPINFIHQEDCIGIILKIISSDSWNEIYNGVSPFHPTREAYYTQKATELSLVLPKFDHSKPSTKKFVLSNKVETVLGYDFIKTNL